MSTRRPFQATAIVAPGSRSYGLSGTRPDRPRHRPGRGYHGAGFSCAAGAPLGIGRSYVNRAGVSTSVWRKTRLAKRVRPLRRLPALSWLPGQRPTQEAAWPAVGKRGTPRGAPVAHTDTRGAGTSPLADLVRFLFFSAWRVGEVRTLKCKHYDRREGTIELRPEHSKNKHWAHAAAGRRTRRYHRPPARARCLDCPFIFHRDGQPMGDVAKPGRPPARPAPSEGASSTTSAAPASAT